MDFLWNPVGRNCFVCFSKSGKNFPPHCSALLVCQINMLKMGELLSFTPLRLKKRERAHSQTFSKQGSCYLWTSDPGYIPSPPRDASVLSGAPFFVPPRVCIFPPSLLKVCSMENQNSNPALSSLFMIMAFCWELHHHISAQSRDRTAEGRIKLWIP